MRPVWGATLSFCQTYHNNYISIYAPRMGRYLSKVNIAAALLQISIYAPRMGRYCNDCSNRYTAGLNLQKCEPTFESITTAHSTASLSHVCLRFAHRFHSKCP